MNIFKTTRIVALVGISAVVTGCAGVPKAAQMTDCTNALIGTGVAQKATNGGLMEGTLAADNITILSGAAGDVAAAGIVDANIQLTQTILGGLKRNAQYLGATCPQRTVAR